MVANSIAFRPEAPIYGALSLFAMQNYTLFF